MHKTLLSILLILLLFPVTVFANAAEPPSLTLLVSGAPDDLVIEISEPLNGLKHSMKKSFWFNDQYTFHLMDFHAGIPVRLELRSGGETRTLQFVLEKQYASLYSVDYDNMRISVGKSALRQTLLTLSRLMLTLAVEGTIFYLFGYRTRRAWLWFLFVNLLSQIFLFFMLNQLHPAYGYPAFSLIFAEIIILVAEMLLLPQGVREHRKSRAVLFALIANVASLMAGLWLLERISL